ncbi:MAG: hypothetical protein HQ580_01435 [Planctomycetes bacterium]|nr:hypothetical protein [Planctomycetota bacterium]
MKPITKQLIIGAFILALVTVASLGIRHIRFSANTIESPVIAKAEPDHHPTDSYTVVAEPDPQYADASEMDEEVPLEDYSETKPSKDDYAKAKGSKGLEKISMGDNENLYITGEGKLWYVSKGADGKTTKMQVQIDETTGEMNVVDWSNYDKSGGSAGMQKISMGDNDNLYITGEGELWYTSEQGSGSKAQVEVDDTTGEITVIKQFSGDDDK